MKTIPLVIFVIIIPLISSKSTRGIPGFHPIQFVVRGSTASEGQFPYIVSFHFKNRGHQCGGSILNKRWILTAAHCIEHDGNKGPAVPISNMFVIAGTNLVSSGGTKYKVEKAIVHENYLFDTRENDVALLKLNKDIEFSDKVTSISLATKEVPAGARVTSAGWGESTVHQTPTNELQFLEMETINIATCKRNHPNDHVFDSNICTKVSGGQGTCSGDSGGPLVYNEQLVGALSWGLKCGGPEPEVYSRVTAFRSWIDSKIK